MGGKKKQTLKQMEKTQEKKATSKKEKRATATGEKKSILGITSPSMKEDKLKDELKKMKVITPYSVASRFELRLSVARDWLQELERKGTIQFVSKSRNLKIYKASD
jgi:small subunit ribosomal protein S25e